MITTKEQLQKLFYRAIEKKDGKESLTPDVEHDIQEVIELLTETMEEMGLAFAPILALASINGTLQDNP